MTEKEKTASMTESGVCAEQGDFYNGKVSENVEDGQVLEAENADDPQPDFSLTDEPEPSPDDTTAEVTELPTWGLPPELQNVVDEVTKCFQCSRDYAVASMMVATSTMLGKRVSCEFNGYKNYPSLWVAIVGRTASGKTAPLSWFFKPIDLMEKDAFKVYRNERHEWEQADPKVRGEKPELRHLLINNPSDESVLQELSANESICWKTDELRTMFDSWGKYSKNGSGAIVGQLLSIFNNEIVIVTRVTKEPICIPEPNLNIIGGIQPPVLKRVMGNRGFTDDGLFQRFLFVFPEATDIPPFADNAISDQARQQWNMTIERLAHIGNLQLHEIDTAKQMHVDYINQLRGECNEHYREIDAMTSLLQKLEIHLCRWSIAVATLSGQQEITAEVMQYSIECMEYFKRCGEKAYCLIANEESHPQELTRGDIFMLLQKWYGKDEPINQSALARALHVSQQAINKYFK